MFRVKRQLVFIFLVFLLKHKVTFASMWPTQKYSEHNVYLQGFTLESFKVNTIFQCYRRCEENIHCASININLTDMTCELKTSTKTRHPEKTVPRPNTVYMEIRDHFTPGSDPGSPIVSCKHLKQNHYYAKSGVYWMKFNEPSSAPFQVFCDMTTDGGGWTLVYSYTFTQYSSFISLANAVTPIPNWPVDKSSGTWVPVSTTTPLSESSLSAMDFALWKKIGRGFLIKSNITNWVACEEGTGSLVNWVAGNLDCSVVEAITICNATAPDTLKLSPSPGPGFRFSGNSGVVTHPIQFSFDGRTDKNWPTHDPCALNYVTKHVMNVANPGGAVYIR